MMLLLLQATLGAIGPQELPREGCAAYLWSLSGSQSLVAMADPARLRINLDGRTVDLSRVASEGVAGLGLASTTYYAAGDLTATVVLTVTERPELAKGGIVGNATLTLQPRGGDTIVTPVAGMAGCR